MAQLQMKYERKNKNKEHFCHKSETKFHIALIFSKRERVREESKIIHLNNVYKVEKV